MAKMIKNRSSDDDDLDDVGQGDTFCQVGAKIINIIMTINIFQDHQHHQESIGQPLKYLAAFQYIRLSF